MSKRASNSSPERTAVGAESSIMPKDVGAYVPAGGAIGFQNHYTPFGKEAVDKSQIALYFYDKKSWFSVTRVFLPNYFATFRERLRAEPIFQFLVGNQGAIHELRGDAELAAECFAEAAAFSRR